MREQKRPRTRQESSEAGDRTKTTASIERASHAEEGSRQKEEPLISKVAREGSDVSRFITRCSTRICAHATRTGVSLLRVAPWHGDARLRVVRTIQKGWNYPGTYAHLWRLSFPERRPTQQKDDRLDGRGLALAYIAVIFTPRGVRGVGEWKSSPEQCNNLCAKRVIKRTTILRGHWLIASWTFFFSSSDFTLEGEVVHLSTRGFLCL